jgi:hypothetical protein
MALLPLVLAAHFIGDWIVQTDWQAANKMTSWRANQMHIAGYHACILAAVLCAPISGVARAVIVGVSWGTHSIINRRWPVKWLMCHTGSAPFSETTFGVIAVDQALHLSILCVLAAVFAR